jgi:hypothetical protein
MYSVTAEYLGWAPIKGSTQILYSSNFKVLCLLYFCYLKFASEPMWLSSFKLEVKNSNETY